MVILLCFDPSFLVIDLVWKVLSLRAKDGNLCPAAIGLVCDRAVDKLELRSADGSLTSRQPHHCLVAVHLHAEAAVCHHSRAPYIVVPNLEHLCLIEIAFQLLRAVERCAPRKDSSSSRNQTAITCSTMKSLLVHLLLAPCSLICIFG